MNATTNQIHQSMPAELAAVALIDAPTAAAPGCVSVSWWRHKVATGEAPQPVINRHRFTRWAMRDVVAFWRDFAAQTDASAADAMKVRASTKASAAARAKRLTMGADTE